MWGGRIKKLWIERECSFASKTFPFYALQLYNLPWGDLPLCKPINTLHPLLPERVSSLKEALAKWNAVTRELLARHTIVIYARYGGWKFRIEVQRLLENTVGVWSFFRLVLQKLARFQLYGFYCQILLGSVMCGKTLPPSGHVFNYRALPSGAGCLPFLGRWLPALVWNVHESAQLLLLCNYITQKHFCSPLLWIFKSKEEI